MSKVSKWLKRLWKQYWAGEKANDFPISKCGLFGEKLKNPANLEQALYALDKMLGYEDRRAIQELDEHYISSAMHHSLGRHLRNEWKLWGDSQLARWFNSKGIHHADDMSGIIITSYWRQQRNVPIQIEEQIQEYQKYWEEQIGEPNHV